MSQIEANEDVVLIDRMNSGDGAAVDAFGRRHARLFYQICFSVAPGEAAAIAAYKDLLAAEAFAQLFSGYDGRAKFSAFAVQVIVKHFLFRRLLGRISADPYRNFAEFHAFWRHGFERKVAERIKDAELGRDALQWIYEKLIDRDCEQLRAWAAEAQKESYIYKKIGFLTRDFLNSRDAPSHTRKRTLPAAIERMGKFEQRVFQQVYWRRTIATRSIWMSLLPVFPDCDENKVVEAKVRIDAELGSKGIAEALGEKEGDFDEASAVKAPNEDEPDFQAFLNRVSEISSAWPNEEKLFLLWFLEGSPSRDIAERMGLPVKTVYNLARRTFEKLKTALKSDPDTKSLIAAVTGDDSYLENELPRVQPERQGIKP